jgi:type I restriction enzyme R subunit
MVKERYKDDSLNITDAGEKVKALINEHLIDLGINPKIPPNELLSDDFMAHVRKHSHGDPEAKASEMEHAIRKHCTIHFDEDPAFYKRLSDKMGKADPAAQKQLASAGRRIRSATQGGLGWPYQCGRRIEQGSATFYDHLVQIAFDGRELPQAYQQPLKKLLTRLVEILQDAIDIIHFWKKPMEVKKLRGNIDTEILLANIPDLNQKHERIAVEIVRLAEKRHGELTK